MERSTRHSRQARSGMARFAFVLVLAIAIAAACGSDDDVVSDVVSSSGEGSGTSAEEVTTDSSQQEPVATTPPISTTTGLDEDGGDPINEAEPSAPSPTTPAADQESIQEQFDSLNEPSSSTTDQSATPDQSAEATGGLNRAFGSNDTVCRSVTVQPSQSTEGLQQAQDCLLAEIAAGRPVVVDFAVVSTEGQPIYYRYAYDGNQILFVNDSRLDSFGSRTVIAQFCESLSSGPLVPVPNGCTPATSSGIAEADG